MLQSRAAGRRPARTLRISAGGQRGCVVHLAGSSLRPAAASRPGPGAWSSTTGRRTCGMPPSSYSGRPAPWTATGSPRRAAAARCTSPADLVHPGHHQAGIELGLRAAVMGW